MVVGPEDVLAYILAELWSHLMHPVLDALVMCRAGPDHTSNARRASALLLMVRVRLPSESLGTALHNLSQDSGDFFTTLSILLYLLDYPTPCSDYYCMYTSWPRAYFHNSSGSSINSSTIVGST